MSPSVSSGVRVLRVATYLLTALTVLVLFVPLNPGPIGSRPDDSWAWAMNEAVAQGMAFGRDIIFNLGPYASVYTRVYHPATDVLMLVGSAFLGACYAAGLVWLAQYSGAWRLVPFVLCIVVFWYSPNSVFVPSRDAVFFSYPLLLTCCVARLLQLPAAEVGNRRFTQVKLAVMFAPMGLLPLVKGSLLFLCACVAAIACGALLLRRGRWAASALIGAAAGAAGFWLAAGQSLADLPAYMRGIGWITSGYSEALANDGPVIEIVGFVLAGALLTAGCLRATPARTRWWVGLCVALFLFVAFKASFVRHDGFHVVTGFAALAVGALILWIAHPPALPVRLALPLAAVMVICALTRYRVVLLEEATLRGPADVAAVEQIPASSVMRSAAASLAKAAATNVRLMRADLESGVRLRWLPGAALQQRFEQDRQAVHARLPLPAFSEGADIYSFDQAYLLASLSRWQPRPTFQSYQAYDHLMELNAAHLRGPRAPANVLLRVQPIDGHFPSIEDGPSWRALLERYRFVDMVGGYAHLRRNDAVRVESMFQTPSPQACALGEDIVLRQGQGLVWAHIDIQPTWLGRLWNVAFKPPRLRMQVELANGDKKEFRVLSNMMRQGFLLDPLVPDTAGFVSLMRSGASAEGLARVKRIAVEADWGEGILWRKECALSLN